MTIRQEDRDQASRDATVVAGLVGAVVGVGVGWGCSALLAWPWAASLAGWIAAGLVCGGSSGWLLAGYTRRAASRLILEGNRIVLADIGRATACYLDYVRLAAAAPSELAAEEAWRSFLAGFREGAAEQGGQTDLRRAFELYEAARRGTELQPRHEAAYFANCLAVLHEHVRLQPYICRSLPFLIRKCVTQRLMTYSVGGRRLAVHEDVPPLADAPFPPTLAEVVRADLADFLYGAAGWDVGRGQLANTRAADWTQLRQRMGYIVNLFRTQHLSPEVVAAPYTPEQLAAIAAGRLPAPPW